MSARIMHLCKEVARFSCELNRVRQDSTAHAVLLRINLAAMTTELLTANLVERLQRSSRSVS